MDHREEIMMRIKKTLEEIGEEEFLRSNFSSFNFNELKRFLEDIIEKRQIF